MHLGPKSSKTKRKVLAVTGAAVLVLGAFGGITNASAADWNLVGPNGPSFSSWFETPTSTTSPADSISSALTIAEPEIRLAGPTLGAYPDLNIRPMIFGGKSPEAFLFVGTLEQYASPEFSNRPLLVLNASREILDTQVAAVYVRTLDGPASPRMIINDERTSDPNFIGSLPVNPHIEGQSGLPKMLADGSAEYYSDAVTLPVGPATFQSSVAYSAVTADGSMHPDGGQLAGGLTLTLDASGNPSIGVNIAQRHDIWTWHPGNSNTGISTNAPIPDHGWLSHAG